MRSRLKLGSPSGESMLIVGRTLSRHASVPRMWQARMRIEKRTGSWHASERPKPASTKRAKDSRLLRGSSRDRKSTRLNSSHTVISYAVFCLKKKKKTKKNIKAKTKK